MELPPNNACGRLCRLVVHAEDVAIHREAVGMILVGPRQCADAVRAEELRFVEHSAQDALELLTVDGREQWRPPTPGSSGLLMFAINLAFCSAKYRALFLKVGSWSLRSPVKTAEANRGMRPTIDRTDRPLLSRGARAGQGLVAVSSPTGADATGCPL